MKSKLTVKQISIIGLMAALVFVSSKIEIRIPSILGVTRFHLGNGMCILSGLLMGALPGGLAAGLGSFFFDLVFWGGNPVGWCVTFATKFLMGYFAGLFYHRETFSHLGKTANIAICGAIGELAYIIGYLAKEFITYRLVMGNPMEAVFAMLVQKGLTSVINAVIAVIVAEVLFRVLVPILHKSGLSYEQA